ncbi:MAG TPA: endonuclease, partial [Flavobacterium sp.]|nr:endonuclease [Flavobacterium sp.]
MKKNILSFITFLVVCFYSFGQQNIPSYYSSIDLSLSGTALKQQLATLITNTHTKKLTYSQVWDAIKITDLDSGNTSNVILLYGWPNVTTGKQARTRAKNNNGGGNGQWNREHTYAQSLGTPALGKTGAGADAHHLRSADV